MENARLRVRKELNGLGLVNSGAPIFRLFSTVLQILTL